MPYLQVSEIFALLTGLVSHLERPSLDSPSVLAQLELLVPELFRHAADFRVASFLTSFLAHSDLESQVVRAKLTSNKHLRNKDKRKFTFKLPGGHLFTLSTTVVSGNLRPKQADEAPHARKDVAVRATSSRLCSKLLAYSRISPQRLGSASCCV
jgi:hypothetical protein